MQWHRVQYRDVLASGPFELVYATGGHGGPYHDMTNAVERAEALLKGCHSEHTIGVVPRNKSLSLENAAVIVTKKEHS